jgi:hypothetical protein
MCIFCLEDDTPFHLRKSSAFPRKMVAEAVELGTETTGSRAASVSSKTMPDRAQSEPKPSAQFDSPVESEPPARFDN